MGGAGDDLVGPRDLKKGLRMLINTEPNRPSPVDSMAEEGLAGIDELPAPRATDESELDAGESLSSEEVDEVTFMLASSNSIVNKFYQ